MAWQRIFRDDVRLLPVLTNYSNLVWLRGFVLSRTEAGFCAIRGNQTIAGL